MHSSMNPLFFPDTMRHIFVRISGEDFKNFRQVCRDWRNFLDNPEINTLQALVTEYNVPEAVIPKLKSREVVRKRLAKIFKRGKVSSLDEHYLYNIYCISGTTDGDFVRLLDTDERWYETYFADRDAFFLEYNLRHACIVGNFLLVKFLIEKKGCHPTGIHLNLATASGELSLIQYLLEIKQCAPIIELEMDEMITIRTIKTNIFDQALYSGSIEVLQYMMQKFNWEPSQHDFCNGVISGNIELVKYLRETFNFSININTSILHSRSVLMLAYLMDFCEGSHDNVHRLMLLTAYESGLISEVTNVEQKYQSVARFEIPLSFAVKSGNIESVKHLLKRCQIKSADLLSHIGLSTVELSLLYAFESGSLEVIEFLVEECGLKPTGEDFLLEYAAQSGNGLIVRYLIDKHQYAFSTDIFITACRNNNFASISLLFSLVDVDDLHSHLARLSTFNPLCVYYLLSREHYPAQKEMLEGAFSGYQSSNDKDFYKLFIQYLIDVHHLTPTPWMLETVAENGDMEMLAILHGESETADPSVQRRS